MTEQRPGGRRSLIVLAAMPILVSDQALPPRRRVNPRRVLVSAFVILVAGAVVLCGVLVRIHGVRDDVKGERNAARVEFSTVREEPSAARGHLADAQTSLSPRNALTGELSSLVDQYHECSTGPLQVSSDMTSSDFEAAALRAKGRVPHTCSEADVERGELSGG